MDPGITPGTLTDCCGDIQNNRASKHMRRFHVLVKMGIAYNGHTCDNSCWLAGDMQGSWALLRKKAVKQMLNMQ